MDASEVLGDGKAVEANEDLDVGENVKEDISKKLARMSMKTSAMVKLARMSMKTSAMEKLPRRKTSAMLTLAKAKLMKMQPRRMKISALVK